MWGGPRRRPADARGCLIDVAEVRLELGEPLPRPDPSATDPEMDLEEPIFLHLLASSEVAVAPAGVVVP